METPQKYPRTYHWPTSPGVGSDDKMLRDAAPFLGIPLVITEKLDGGNCLEGHTLILTKDYGLKTIQWICENQFYGLILAYNTFTGEETWEYVEDWFIGDEEENWFEIELDNGKTLIATGIHYIWLPLLSCYRQVKDLIEGDMILLKN